MTEDATKLGQTNLHAGRKEYKVGTVRNSTKQPNRGYFVFKVPEINLKPAATISCLPGGAGGLPEIQSGLFDRIARTQRRGGNFEVRNEDEWMTHNLRED